MIINADDFGLSESVNQAILESFERGWISSTTLMATMPGFEHACQLARQHRLEHHIGAHLVMTEGPALTEAIRRCRRLCDTEGQLRLGLRRSNLRLAADERSALAEELAAQIRRIRSQGLPITHADSHHHAHTVWGILAVVIQVLRQERVPALRLSRNCGRGKGPLKACYTRLFNARVRRAGLARTARFGSIDDYAQLRRELGRPPQPQRGAGQGVLKSAADDQRTLSDHPGADGPLDDIEIMVHPLYNGQGVLVDKVDDRPLAAAIALIDGHRRAVSYDGTARR